MRRSDVTIDLAAIRPLGLNPIPFLRGALCLNRRYKQSRYCGKLDMDGYAHHAYTTSEGPRFKPSNTEQIQAISGRLGSSGFLSGEHAGARRLDGEHLLLNRRQTEVLALLATTLVVRTTPPPGPVIDARVAAGSRARALEREPAYRVPGSRRADQGAASVRLPGPDRLSSQAPDNDFWGNHNLRTR